MFNPQHAATCPVMKRNAAGSNKHFARRTLPQKGRRARRCAIGPGLENGDEIAHFGARQRDLIAEPVERGAETARSEEHTSELQSLLRISSAVFCFKKQKQKQTENRH